MTTQEKADDIMTIASNLDEEGTDKQIALSLVAGCISALKSKENHPRLISEMEDVRTLINNL